MVFHFHCVGDAVSLLDLKTINSQVFNGSRGSREPSCALSISAGHEGKEQIPGMGTEAAEKAVIAVDAVKVLDPRWLKPNSIETERILSVLDETIAKLELSSLIPRIIGSLDRFADLLGPEITASLMEYQQLSNQMEHLLVAAEEEGTAEAEEQRGSLHLLEQHLKCSVRNILRLLLAIPSLCKALKYEVWAREPATEAFIKAFGEFRNFMLERLLTSPTKEEEMVQLMEDISLRINRNTETITALQAELAAAIRTQDEEVWQYEDMFSDKGSLKQNFIMLKIHPFLAGPKEEVPEMISKSDSKYNLKMFIECVMLKLGVF